MKILCKTVLLMQVLLSVASANGTMSDPISRVYQCREEGPQHLVSEACKAAAKKGAGLQQFYDWSDVSQEKLNANHKKTIADTELCSAGNARYAGLDLARDDWAYTSLKANEAYTFKYFESTPHDTEYFKYYITRDGYNPKKPLHWNDLELLCEEGEQKAESFHAKSCVMPDKVGKHIIYTIWKLSDEKKSIL